MTNEVNIRIPAISPELIAALDRESEIATATEVEALAAIRQTYGPLARHNGFIRTGYRYRGDGANFSDETEWFHLAGKKKVRGLLVDDDFGETNDDQNRGAYVGSRLYLTEAAEWVRITRRGRWSRWQGAGEWWYCFDQDDQAGGSVRVLTDAEVEPLVDLEDLAAELAKQVQVMAEKLPARLTGIKQRSATAAALLAALA